MSTRNTSRWWMVAVAAVVAAAAVWWHLQPGAAPDEGGAARPGAGQASGGGAPQAGSVESAQPPPGGRRAGEPSAAVTDLSQPEEPAQDLDIPSLDRPVPLGRDELKAALESEIVDHMAEYVPCLAAWHGELGYASGELFLVLTWNEQGLVSSRVRAGDEQSEAIPLATRSCLAGFVEDMDGFASREGEVTIERRFRFLSAPPASVTDEEIRAAVEAAKERAE